MAAEISIDPCEIRSVGSPQQVPSFTPKSWNALHQNVVERRKLMTALASRVPNSFTFRKVESPSGSRTRLYFLGIPAKSRETTLLYIDIPNDQKDAYAILEWKNLLDSFQTSSLSQLSREEQLLRERKRLGIFGITSYDLVEQEGKFVFPACNNMYVCADHNILTNDPVLPMEINTSCTGARLDPKICSYNPDLVAFIHNNDVWVTNLVTNQECRLTFAHKGLSSLAADPLNAGVPSFVVQEEFDRYTGYWWEPRPLMSSENNRKYRILYEEVDESEVEILNIFAQLGRSVDEYRYPRAGTTNAKSVLKIVEFEIGEDGQIQDSIIERQLYGPLTTFFPWMEYLVRAGWTPDGKYVYAQLMDRRQSRLSLVLLPVECFVPIATDNDMEMTYESYSNSYPPLQIIYEDTSEVWVNTHDILHFLPHKKEMEVRFIWSSEKTGYRHLYCVTSKLASCDNNDLRTMDILDKGYCNAEVIEELALTKGEWEVLGKQIWVDESRNLVYFTGLKDYVLETHLYSVSYKTPKEPVRLTEPGYSHAVSLSSDCSLFVSVYSSVEQTPMSVVYKIGQTTRGQLCPKLMGTLMPSVACPEYHPPELFSFNSQSGCIIHGLFFKPYNYEPDLKYPTVLMVYGGPQVQQVTNSFKGIRFLRHHTLASQGYVVVVIDGRGSCNRGIQFESQIKNQLGTVEIADQVEGLHWLAANTNMIDLNRVAIHGWSYGGYLSLLGLAQRPEIFKVAIAGAPVVSWLLYDTGYTERYMDLPERNEDGYQKGSVLNYVEQFPDEENRLLIIHGLIDENVHFHHTSTLINALVKACKPYRLQVYPNERHGIRNHEASEHYKTMILSFLQQNL